MSRLYRFGEYQLNAERRTLLRGATPVPITARAFDILLALIEQRHRVVEKDDLLARVWPEQVVEEGNLTQQVFVLRRLLGGSEYIATVPRRGYQFVATVDEITLPSTPSAGAPVSGNLRLHIALDPPIVLGPNPALVIARDTSFIVYVGEYGATTALFVRRLDSYDTRMVSGTAGATAPFLSPDGRWIGYASGGRLWRVALDGGTALPICEVEGEGRGASWGAENLIAFAPAMAGPLHLVAAAGGRPRPLTRLAFIEGERSHRYPAFTDDGRLVIFTIACAGDSSFDEARIAMVAPDSGTHRVILAGASCGAITGSSRLHYQRAGMLFVTEFDAVRGACDHPGEPREAIATHEVGAAHVAVAPSGLTVLAPRASPRAPARLVFADEAGHETAVDELPGVPEEPRISPDGRHIVVGVRRDTADLWLYDLERRTLTRLTDAGDNFAAIWTPDGQSIVFSSNRAGPSNLYQLPINRPDAAIRLLESAAEQVPGAWTPDGRTLIFTEYDAQSGADLWQLGSTGPAVLMRSRFNEYAPACSPDGRWMAYTSDASGRCEVYVVRYPEMCDRQQLSRDGGSEPVWSSTGLYFRSAAALCFANIDPAGAISGPREIGPDHYLRGSLTGLANYDIHPDGRLLAVAPPMSELTRAVLHVVVPFDRELSRGD